MSEFKINKKGFIETEGEVIELLPNTSFKVIIKDAQNNKKEISAHLSGKMRMHRIRILAGDHVQIELSPYDLTKGRITYRF